MAPWLASAMVATAMTLLPQDAAAYCRKTNRSPSDGSYDPALMGTCGDRPGAAPLYWRTDCIPYEVVVDEEMQALLSVEEAQNMVRRCADKWQNADCAKVATGKNAAAKPPAFRMVDTATEVCPNQSASEGAAITCNNAKIARKNVLRFAAAKDTNTLGVTNPCHGPEKPGEIIVATITINDSVTESAVLATPEDKLQQLEFTMLHEMGHFLGLGHSEKDTAVMYKAYNGKQSPTGLDLTDDDLVGICNIYDANAPLGVGCSVSSSGTGRVGTLGVLLPLLGVLAARLTRALRRLQSRSV
jgi:Matrixin